jgi:hypothetical protein
MLSEPSHTRQELRDRLLRAIRDAARDGGLASFAVDGSSPHQNQWVTAAQLWHLVTLLVQISRLNGQERGAEIKGGSRGTDRG